MSPKHDAAMLPPTKMDVSTAPADRAAVDRLGAWIVLSCERTRRRRRSPDLPYGALLGRRLRRPGSEDAGEPCTLDLPNARGTRAVLAAARAEASTFELLGLARRLVGLVWDTGAQDVGVSVEGWGEAGERIMEIVLSALLAKAAPMPCYKRERRPARTLRLRLFGCDASPAFARAFAEAGGNAVARYLAALPPNELTPGHYRDFLAGLAAEQRLGFEFLDVAALKRRGAGAFLAVVRGSPAGDAGIAKISYRPARGRRGAPVALVGKGICFDTGGVNLKSHRHMLDMHEDMAGSAIALGTLLALAKLEVDFAVDAWLAIAANHIGPEAYQPHDIVTAVDGTTIEIVHTDAEGRLVLADTLALAARTKPRLVIDYATLTGTCIYSLGRSYSGVFTNREDWLPLLVETGRASGERVWPFPQDADYDKSLESTIADVKQCAVEGDADQILAARFLSRFVGSELPWIHLDLAAAHRKGGLAHVPTDATGFGVRYTCSLLLDRGLTLG
ncbi:MAG: leucyl aminopeptidase family protein [Gammaproteobacteria bacterium]|nr:leucyl aminopeptidase family protein [Gammaproteobacteria bacterium]